MKLPIVRLDPPPVYFMHVPKTAGSSLRTLIITAYPKSVVGLLYDRRLQSVTASQLLELRFIASHFGPGLLPWLPQPGLVCVTMLRDPVEQFVSHLYYRQAELNRNPGRFQPDYFAQVQSLRQADLRTLLTTPIMLIPDNPQTRCLGAMLDLRPYFQDGEIGCKGESLPSLPFAYSLEMDLAQVATNAHHQLETMAVVGITERFGESMALLCELLGVSVPSSMPMQNLGVQKRNVAAHDYRARLAPDLLDYVRAKTSYDQALYQQACEQFAGQWARHCAKPHRSYSISPRLRVQMRAWLPTVTQITRHTAPRLVRNSKLRRLHQMIKSRVA